MIRKIISGGQTGADQAALDAAMKLGVPHGGWIPKGRLTEAGTLPDKYQLKEMPTESYPERTEKNIVESDGTVIISHEKLIGGSKLTQKLAQKHKRPCLHIDLNKTLLIDAASTIHSWLQENFIEILNVAGPRASKDPKIYDATLSLLERVFQSLKVEKMALSIGPSRTLPMRDKSSKSGSDPKTVRKAVERLIYHLSLKDRIRILEMDANEVSMLNHTMGKYIRNRFGLRYGNTELIESCRKLANKDDVNPDDASEVIISELWKTLRDTHRLRVVK